MTINRVAFAVVIVGLLGCAGCATEDPVKATLDRAFAARAPANDLPSFGGWEREVDGKWRGMDFHARVVFGRPNLLRREFEPFGLGHAEVYVFDGKQLYREEAGGRQQAPHPEDAQVFRDAIFDEAFLYLADLRDPTFSRELVADAPKLDGKPVVQLIVARAGIERTLSFDASTFDLVGIAGNTWTGMGESGREPLDTRFFDFETVDGLRVPGRFEVRSNGNMVIEGTFARWKPLREIPDVTTRAKRQSAAVAP